MRYLITVFAVFVTFTAFGAGAQASIQYRYCLIQAVSEAKNCGFSTMAQCLQSKGSPSDTCELNNGNSSDGWPRS